MQQIADWLEKLGMSEYAGHFGECANSQTEKARVTSLNRWKP